MYPTEAYELNHILNLERECLLSINLLIICIIVIWLLLSELKGHFMLDAFSFIFTEYLCLK